jgi:tetratricopeptide (TPR) repeat protein
LVSVGKDIVTLLRDASVLLLAGLLICFPNRFNSILVQAGFEEGSIVGFKWKSKLVESDAALREAQEAITDLQAKNDEMVKALAEANSKVIDPSLRERVAKLDKENDHLKITAQQVQKTVAQTIASNAPLVEKARSMANPLAEQERKAKAERLLSNGVELAGRGRLTDAIALYDEAIKLSPQSANLFQFRGYALLRRSQMKPGTRPNDLRDAVVSLEQAVRLDPSNAWSHYNLSLAYWEEGDKERAVDEVRRVLQIDATFRDIIDKDVQFTPFRELSTFRSLMGTGRP